MPLTELFTGETPQQKDIRLHKDLAAFSYIWIMSVVCLLSRRTSPFVQYHARQGLVLFLLSIPIASIPYAGRILILPIIAGCIYGFLNALKGRYVDVPLMGPLSRGELKTGDLWPAVVSIFKTSKNEIGMAKRPVQKGSSVRKSGERT